MSFLKTILYIIKLSNYHILDLYLNIYIIISHILAILDFKIELIAQNIK